MSYPGIRQWRSHRDADADTKPNQGEAAEHTEHDRADELETAFNEAWQLLHTPASRQHLQNGTLSSGGGIPGTPTVTTWSCCCTFVVPLSVRQSVFYRHLSYYQPSS